ncbi:WcbI family polysaccharide biosynthesis putative acetyltransferase [Corynebacterium sp.]|uniref:WcbI family polysaccharide biosynthesis putative acetyltransferase n=1 Tax=Corynebacterium sp. TaxID=1720 RepID=UPI002A91E49A|nr:WcbI family polysaccharide biosynthesis putative acetyltransferase [Corynebacterium sp.]MDY5784723.1 WcbI family polysaccharide biosynthesis putative acetyltransferase [Corynebacterium sp.]
MATLTVVGNCQAESTRRLLMTTGLFESERITPVHELTRDDMGWFSDLISRTDVLITQPIRANYRGLPVGSAQLRELLPATARHVLVPVLRFDGLMPYQAIIRDPADPSLNPPVVPYHDLRILTAVAQNVDAPVESHPSPAALRRAAAMSVEQMRIRERHHGTVVVSDHLETHPVWHTVNHPDNATLAELARAVLAELGVTGEVTLPDYEMLGELDAPIDTAAADALGVHISGRDQWRKRREGTINQDEIAQSQMEFYRRRPALVRHGLERHAERIANLGLMP